MMTRDSKVAKERIQGNVQLIVNQYTQQFKAHQNKCENQAESRKQMAELTGGRYLCVRLFISGANDMLI
jgi:DNA-directed RNA polymerase subunit N (RpoN/RPB10)